MSSDRWSKKVDGGILIEDDGGFVNFFSSSPGPCLGSIMGFGFDDEEEPQTTPTLSEQPEKEPAKVIDLLEWKKRNRR